MANVMFTTSFESDLRVRAGNSNRRSSTAGLRVWPDKLLICLGLLPMLPEASEGWATSCCAVSEQEHAIQNCKIVGKRVMAVVFRQRCSILAQTYRSRTHRFDFVT